MPTVAVQPLLYNLLRYTGLEFSERKNLVDRRRPDTLFDAARREIDAAAANCRLNPVTGGRERRERSPAVGRRGVRLDFGVRAPALTADNQHFVAQHRRSEAATFGREARLECRPGLCSKVKGVYQGNRRVDLRFSSADGVKHAV